MHFGVYGRKSYFKDTSESTQMQFTLCEKHIRDRFDDVDSITFYEDDGYIRTDMDRPGMDQLKADIASGLLDCVVIYRIDRVCSEMIDFCTFYTYLKEHDVKFIMVKEGIDTTTPMGEAMMYLAVIFSGMEIRNDTMRITDNMNHLASKGFWCGGQPPVGYIITPVEIGKKKSHKILTFNQTEIDYKNMLVDIFLENHFSLQNMETYCKNNHILTLNGKFLSTTQLYSMFTSPHCVADTPAMYDYFESKGCVIDEDCQREKWDGTHGILVYGRTQERKVNGKKKHELAPPTNWRISIGRHLPYMTDAKYFQILSQFGNNTFSKTPKYDLPLLKGAIRCKCGRTLGMSRKKYVDGSVGTWYYCPRRMRSGADSCGMSQIKSDLLDEKVLEIFRSIEHDPDVIKNFMGKTDKPAKDTSMSIRVSMENCQAKIDKLASILSSSADSTAAKYIVNQIEKLDIEYNNLRKKSLSLSAEKRRAEAAVKSAMEKREDIVRLLEHFDDFTSAEKNEIARSVLKECVWDGETLFVTL